MDEAKLTKTTSFGMQSKHQLSSCDAQDPFARFHRCYRRQFWSDRRFKRMEKSVLRPYSAAPARKFFCWKHNKIRPGNIFSLPKTGNFLRVNKSRVRMEIVSTYPANHLAKYLVSIRQFTSLPKSMHGHFHDTIHGSLACALQSPRKYIHSAGVENVSHRDGDVDTARNRQRCTYPTNTRVLER
jgi:hypothetical protein